MHAVRQKHTASVLTNRKVLVAGEYDGTSDRNSAKLCDPIKRTWTIISKMNNVRNTHTASVLIDGNVLVIQIKETEKEERNTFVFSMCVNYNMKFSLRIHN